MYTLNSSLQQLSLRRQSNQFIEKRSMPNDVLVGFLCGLVLVATGFILATPQIPAAQSLFDRVTSIVKHDSSLWGCDRSTEPKICDFVLECIKVCLLLGFAFKLSAYMYTAQCVYVRASPCFPLIVAASYVRCKKSHGMKKRQKLCPGLHRQGGQGCF